MTRITYDEIGEALAITLHEGASEETIEIADGVLLDVDADGRPLSLEFVSLRSLPPFLAAHGGEYVLPERIVQTTSKRRSA
ncbi:MAG: DUF2283 domain-containing protein [Thermomicrobiales bacterium]